MKKSFLTTICFACLLIGHPVAAQNDEALFRRHIITSGLHGLMYGIAFNVVADLEGAAAIGLPIVTAGTSVLIPLLTTPTITTNSLLLANHGKMMGWIHGFALSGLILGDELFTGDNYKITIGAGALGSIGLGIAGRLLGQFRPWEEGQAALFAHYGILMPFVGFWTNLTFATDVRIISAISLLSGASGYFLANRISRSIPHTRGDVRAIRTLTLLNAGLSGGILLDLLGDNAFGDTDFKRTNLLLPAFGALAGTALGHLWLRNTMLTNRQGNITAFAATGGAVVGLGIALIAAPGESWPYYVFPYAAGMGAFAIAVEGFRNINKTAFFNNKKNNNKANYSFHFMPWNLAFNQKMTLNGPPSIKELRLLQPLVSLSMKF